jgi:transcriptional regulator with XRE-family HTH domain
MPTFKLASSGEIRLALANRLRDQRLHQGLTQTELAERAGVGRLVVLQLENEGKGSLDSFIKIVSVLGLQDALENLFVLNTNSISALEKLGELPKRAPRRKR